MSVLTVRKLDEEVMSDLRISAAKRGVSMEQEARDRLRQPLGGLAGGQLPGSDTPRWRLKASKEEILALGRKLPKDDFDQKSASDELYAYLDEEA